MALQQIGSEGLSCPRGHENRGGAEWCTACGMPVIDFDEEMDRVLRLLAGWERHTRFVKERVFIGVGGQGTRLVSCFCRYWAEYLKSSEYLLIDSSPEIHSFASSVASTKTGGDEPARVPRRHQMPGSQSRQLGYFGLGEFLAQADDTLNDTLMKCGVRPASSKQLVLTVSALGGGTGAGVSPNVLQRVRSLNPNCRNVIIAIMPGDDEPDSAHFNAYCSLSRFIRSEAGPLADMVLLVDHDRLMRLRGVDSRGEEMANDSLVSHMIAVLTGGAAELGKAQTDPGYLARMSRSMGIHAFVPCLAVGRSLEIFGSLTNILESALACPLAPIDRESIALSFVLVQVPERLVQSMPEERLRAELNKWNKERFPNLRGGAIQFMHSNRGSDRIDVCFLLGGTKLEIAAGRAKEGFESFKSVVESDSWAEEYSSPGAVFEVDQAVRWYDGRLDDTGTRTEGVYVWTNQSEKSAHGQESSSPVD